MKLAPIRSFRSELAALHAVTSQKIPEAILGSPHAIAKTALGGLFKYVCGLPGAILGFNCPS